MNTTKQSPCNLANFALSLLTAAAVILLGISALAQEKAPITPAKKDAKPPAFAGSDACNTCHEDQAKWLKGSVHGATMLAEAKKPSKGQGCESCHGPGDTHANDPKKENILTFKTETALQRSNACLNCHNQRAGQADFIRTKHRKNKIACDQCHAGKDSKNFHSMRSGEDLDRGPSTALCLNCHGEKRAAFSMPFHHRVNEGLLSCADCHREHMGFLTGRRRTEQNDEICVSCHTEKRGPFVFVHLPARVGGCTTCHQPHGSTNPRLLVRSTVRTLCLECHTNTPRTHNLNQSQYQNCIVCHKAVHGSNHDKKFFE